MTESLLSLFILERDSELLKRLLAFFELRHELSVAGAVWSPEDFLSTEVSCRSKLLPWNRAALLPDVTVMDFRAPSEEELAVLAKLKKSGSPVIAFTAFPLSRSAAVELGFYAVVKRPHPDEEAVIFSRLLYHVRNSCFDKIFRRSHALPYIHSDKGPNISTTGLSTLSSVPASAVHGISKSSGASVRLIAIGASAGGTDALLKLVAGFPAEFPCVLIVQHITKGFCESLAVHLTKRCAIPAVVAYDGAPVRKNVIYIAPDDLHMRVERSCTRLFLRCAKGEKLSGHRPSVDALFSSVAEKAGPSAIGIILTGMGSDGAHGLLEMRSAGAFTIGQDEASSLIYGMPRAAYLLGAVEKQLPLEAIAQELILRICR